MTWGMVGKTAWGKNPRAKGRPGEVTNGFIRDLDPGVDYKSLAECQLSMPQWQPLRDEEESTYTAAKRWIMPLGQNDAPAQIITFGQLATKVRELHRRNDPGLKSYLSVLDDATDQLLILADQLHAQYRCLGLLHPNNIMLYLQADGTWKVVLPDTGFAWRYQGAGNVPDWLKPNHPDLKMFAELWDAAPDEWNKRICRHQWSDAPVPSEEWSQTQDVRLLARLLYWVLTGDVVKTVPPPSDAVPRSKMPTLVPLSETLKDPNKLPTTRQFRVALKSSGKRMSDYFAISEDRFVPPGPERRSLGAGAWIGGGVGLAALVVCVIFGAQWLMNGGGDRPEIPDKKSTDQSKTDKIVPIKPPITDKIVPQSDPFAKIKEAWPKVKGKRSQEIKLIEEAAKTSFSNDERRKAEEEFVGQMHRDYCDQWTKDVDEFRGRILPIASKAHGKLYLDEIKEFTSEREQFLRFKTSEDTQCVVRLEQLSRILASIKGLLEEDMARVSVSVLAALGITLTVAVATMSTGQEPAAGLKGEDVGLKQKIVMAMRAPKDITEDQLQSFLARPKQSDVVDDSIPPKFKYQGKHDWKSTKTTLIRREVYESLKELFNSGFTQAGSELRGGMLRRMADSENWYEINLPKEERQNGSRLSKIKIQFGDDDKDAVTLDTKTNPKNLVFHTIGVYALRLPEGKADPKTYAITVYDPVTMKERELERKPWPEDGDNFWLIELSDFTGSLQSLFDGLRDPKVLAAPFQDIVHAKSSTLVVGTMTPDTIIDDGVLIDKNKYIVRMTPPLGKPMSLVRSAWILFPISAEQKDKFLKHYRDPKMFNTDEKLVSSIIDMADKATPGNDANPPELRPEMEPKWFQVPKGESWFEREFKIEDVEGWKNRKDKNGDTRLYRLVVYQFESKIPSAIPLTDPLETPKRSHYVMPRELTQWLASIRQLSDALAKKKAMQ